jgi:amino-acid N-acetyltransferase
MTNPDFLTAPMKLRNLHSDDLPAARELLASSELPIDDIEDPSITFVGAFDNLLLVGVVGLQSCDGTGLLRSLAVSPQHRDHGIARKLCERVFEMTAERKLDSLWLLTTSAKDYFARHAFEAVPRDTAPAAIRSTAQFSSLCPSSAHVMRRIRTMRSSSSRRRRSSGSS